MLMMDKLIKLDQITSQALASSTKRQNGKFHLISAEEKEQCVMENIVPLKKAILKILLYSDVLAEEKNHKSHDQDSSILSYFKKQELPVMQQVTITLSEALILLKIGMVQSAGEKTEEAVQKVMDIKLIDYGVDIHEEAKLEKVDLVECGKYWYDGVQQIQELQLNEQGKESEKGSEKWIQITQKVRKNCLQTATQ